MLLHVQSRSGRRSNAKSSKLLRGSVNFPAFLALTISKSPPNFGKSSPKLRKFLDSLGPKSSLLNFGPATFNFCFLKTFRKAQVV